MSTVLAAFMGGLALGSFGAARYARRVSRPLACLCGTRGLHRRLRGGFSVTPRVDSARQPLLLEFFRAEPNGVWRFPVLSLWCVAASTDSVHGGHASPSRGRGRNEPGRDGSSSWAPLRRQYIGGRAWSCSSGLHPFADARTCCDDQLDRRDEIWRSRARPSRSLADSHLRRPQR